MTILHLPRSQNLPRLSSRALLMTVACLVLGAALASVYFWPHAAAPHDRNVEFFDSQQTSFIGADGGGVTRGGTR